MAEVRTLFPQLLVRKAPLLQQAKGGFHFSCERTGTVLISCNRKNKVYLDVQDNTNSNKNTNKDHYHGDANADADDETLT